MEITPPFGRLITAMVTPFTKELEIDWAGVEKIAAHLVETGHDGIVVNGTTGEAPTTSDDEKVEIIKVVKVITKLHIASFKVKRHRQQALMDC
jgi:4-hydroxy-tetrahydrodipicolinate synthase